MRPGRLNKYVTLSRSPQSSPDGDGFFEALSPSTAWAQIQPVTAGEFERSTYHQITIRFHAQVTMDTRLVYTDAALGRDREFFVKGVQSIDEANKEMRLLCEEITP